jgi:hypothetical protein
MAGKKGGGGGEGSKKAQGQARKADAAASKQAAKRTSIIFTCFCLARGLTGLQ